MNIYCAQHRTNHHLTNTQTEQLIYGLSAHLTDEETSPSEVFQGEDPIAHCYGFCVLSELNLALDGEGYLEHVTQMRERRLTEQSPLPPECPACGTWVCAVDGWRRNRAALSVAQHCHRCGGTKGIFLPTYHSDRATREDHEQQAAQRD